MKQLSIFYVFVILSLPGYSQYIDIRKLDSMKLIEYRITGSWNNIDKKLYLDADGQYFGKCMLIKIQSKIDTSIYIPIEKGQMLISEDTSTQDMIITKSAYVELKPKQNISFELYAMCSEYHDGMPHKRKKYKIGKRADKNLVAIVNEIDDMFMHNLVGQGAVWAYTDSASEKDLRKYGATSKSIPITIEILNKAGVITKLNPIVKDTINESTSNNINSEGDTFFYEDGYVLVNSYVLYGTYGLIMFFLGSTIILLLIARRNKKNKKI